MTPERRAAAAEMACRTEPTSTFRTPDGYRYLVAKGYLIDLLEENRQLRTRGVELATFAKQLMTLQEAKEQPGG